MTVSAFEPRRNLAAVPEREADTRTSVLIGQLIESLRGTSETTAKKQPLTPLRSHDWYSTDNERRVMKSCAAALAASDIAEQSPGVRRTVSFLVAAMVDCYHNDRALFAASQHPDNPVPQRLAEVPQFIQHDERWYEREVDDLVWSPDVPLDADERVADVAERGLPDRFLLVTYKEQRSRTYDPLIYAQYGDWVVKVAEWE